MNDVLIPVQQLIDKEKEKVAFLEDKIKRLKIGIEVGLVDRLLLKLTNEQIK